MVLIRPNYFLDGIMKEVAIRKNTSFTKVQECIASQYDFIRSNIEAFDSKTQTGSRVLYIPNFGKFIISDKVFANIVEKYKDYKEKEEDETI